MQIYINYLKLLSQTDHEGPDRLSTQMCSRHRWQMKVVCHDKSNGHTVGDGLGCLIQRHPYQHLCSLCSKAQTTPNECLLNDEIIKKP